VRILGLILIFLATVAGGRGAYGSGRASQVDYRDDEIAASGNDCP
jgi:hypothetical protein